MEIARLSPSDLPALPASLGVASEVADPAAGLVMLTFGGLRSGAPLEAVTDVPPAAMRSAMQRTTSRLGERRVRIIVRDEGELLGGEAGSSSYPRLEGTSDQVSAPAPTPR